MATVELSARATATAMVEVGCSIKRGATGRVIDTLNNEQWECEARVLEWLDAEGDAAANAGRGLVLKGLQQASQIRAAVCFRARNFATSECPRSDSEIGPSPHLRANRYNRDGEPAMYLCTSVQGLGAEMARYPEPGKVPYFATFRAISGELRIVDLVDPALPAVVHHAFDRAERVDSSTAGHKLADLVRELGYQGMLVPGVRGSPNNRYANLVIFAYEGWKSWVDPNARPQLLFP